MSKPADLLPYINVRRLQAGLHPIASFGAPELRRTACVLQDTVWVYPWRTWARVIEGNDPSSQQRLALVVDKDGRKDWFEDRELAPIDGLWLFATADNVERHLCNLAENAILAAGPRVLPRESRL